MIKYILYNFSNKKVNTNKVITRIMIRSNAVKTAAVEIVADMILDSDMDGDSSLYVSYRRDGSEILHGRIMRGS